MFYDGLQLLTDLRLPCRRNSKVNLPSEIDLIVSLRTHRKIKCLTYL